MTSQQTPKARDFATVPGISCWRYYGIVWPSRITSNGSPHLVRSEVAIHAPAALDEFDEWVADMAGWPKNWHNAIALPRTDWSIKEQAA